ncbi:MAG: cation:proton antiporter, partial [Pseudomonadota bacterium]
MEGFLLQATIYLAAMVVAVPLSVRLGLGSVLGYLLAGIVIGPGLGLVGHETEDLQHVAEFGVVLMLFVIGLELEPRAVWEMRKRLLGLGGAQILLTISALAGLAYLAGERWETALAIGIVLALSSTAIVLQTLNEKALISTPGGRSSFSVLLMQDIAVIPMLALLPLLALPAAMRANEDGSISVGTAEEAHHSLSLVEGLPGWGIALVTIAAIGSVIVVGPYLLHILFRFVHLARLREMYTAFALVIVVGIAFGMLLIGLTPALGAFIAGVVLANSEFRHELEANIEPFKGLLLGLFFITVGAGINFDFLTRNLGDILAITLIVIIVKGLILYAIGWFAGLRERDLWLLTLGLAQAGEFGFVLIAFAGETNVLPVVMGQKLLLVVALSMLFTPLLFILYEYLSRRGTGPAGEPGAAEFEPVDTDAPVIIAGLGRFGQVVHRMLSASGLRTVLLDADIETIRVMRGFGVQSYFGDPTRPELLHAAGLEKAKVVVVAINDQAQAVELVKYVKSVRPEISIVARAHDRLHVYALYAAGADHI